MQINNIKLKNFKSFKELDIDINKMNILVGANASGKSNFIQSIKFLRDIQKYGIENAISLQGGLEYLQNIKLENKFNTEISIEFYSGRVSIIDKPSKNSFILSHFKSINYSIEIASIGNNKFDIVNETLAFSIELRELNQSKGKLNSINKEEFINRTHFIGDYGFSLINKKGKIITQPLSKNKKLKLKLENGKFHNINVSDITIFPMPIEFLKANEQPQKTILEQFPLPIFNLDEIGIYDFDLKNSKKPASITAKAELEENGENLAIVIKNILDDVEQTRRFSNYLTDILPFIKELDIEKSYNKSLLFKVKEKFNPNTYIPSSLLSDGTVSIASIITALFFENKSLTVFEEPEQGVHPSLIAKLMQLFYEASEKKQVIITTHNPEILKHSKIDDLLLITRDDEGFALISRPSEKEIVKSFLNSELGIDQLFIQNLLEI